MTKHTPGPWTIVDYKLTQEILIAGDTGDEIAIIDYSFRPEAHDDAHLIAAAPDLLAACEAVVLHMRRPLNIEETIRVGALLRAAIAKARGQG